MTTTFDDYIKTEIISGLSNIPISPDDSETLQYVTDVILKDFQITDSQTLKLLANEKFRKSFLEINAENNYECLSVEEFLGAPSKFFTMVVKFAVLWYLSGYFDADVDDMYFMEFNKRNIDFIRQSALKRR